MADLDLLSGDLASQARLTHQFIVLIEQFLERKAPHALDKRSVSLDVQTQVEESFFSSRRCLAAHACYHIKYLALKQFLHK